MFKLSSCLSTVFLTLALSLDAGASEYQIFGFARTQPIKPFAEKVSVYLQTIMPGNQVNMLLPMMLAPVGYPTFTGVSTTDNVGVFMIAENGMSFEQASVVIMAKATEDSPVLDAATNYEMAFRQVDGWTLFCNDPAFLDSISDVSPMAAILAKPLSTDLEITYLITDEQKAEFRSSTLESLVEEMVAEGSTPEDIENARMAFEIGYQLFANITAFSMGLNLGTETTDFAFSAEFAPDSVEAQLVNAKSPGKSPLARFVGSEHAIASAASFDQQKLANYLKIKYESLKPQLNPEFQKMFDTVLELNEKYKSFYEGTTASSISFPKEDGWNGYTLTQGKATLKDTQAYCSEVFVKFVNPLLVILSNTVDGMPLMAYTCEIEPDVTIEGSPVIRISPKVTAATLKEPISEEQKSEIESLEKALNSSRSYIAQVGKVQVGSGSIDELRRSAALIKGGVSLPGNLAEDAAYTDDLIGFYRIDLVRYLEEISKFSQNAFDPAQLELLKATQLKPVSMTIKGGSNRLLMTSKMTTEDIAKLIKLSEAESADGQ